MSKTNQPKKEITQYDAVKANLAKVGLDLDSELSELDANVNGNLLPRVRIEHRDNGKHRMYFDLGEAYTDISNEIDIPNNRLQCLVFAYQNIRALWNEGDVTPTCSAIEGRPVVDDPKAENCRVCPASVIGKGECKPKVRLFILTEIEKELKPAIFTLSPTSIKHWNAHLRKMKRSGLPIIAVNTVFTLTAVKKASYSWAEVEIAIDGCASLAALKLAKQLRDEYRDFMGKVSEKDFSDLGDQQHQQQASAAEEEVPF